MADRIITVTDPSVVTNDTLSGYNNYSDIDGQLGTTMTPTEATNGHTVALSDGVVHEVTTKPVGTTNGEFSAVVSNAVTVNLDTDILFEDDFTGTTIDTLKWTTNNDAPTFMTIDQNNEIIFEVVDSPYTGVTGATNIASIDTFNISTIKVLRLDWQSDDANVGGQILGLINNVPQTTFEDYFSIGSTATAGDIQLRVNDAGTNDSSDYTLDVASYKSFKIVVNSTDVSYHYWGGSSWVEMLTKSHTLTGLFRVFATARVYSGLVIGDKVKYNNCYVTDADFSTLNPI